MKEIFFPKRMWRPRRRAEAPLRRRDRRRRLARARHRLLPREAPRRSRTSAILEKSYIGSGASGRNTTIIRSNYRTPEGAEFYGESVRLYEQLSDELDFNLMFSQHGHLTLAHSDRALITMQERAEVNSCSGSSRASSGRRRSPSSARSSTSRDRPTCPILGALYHPPGGIIRHDAVVWGFARAADRLGVEIHPYTEVTGFERRTATASPPSRRTAAASSAARS